MYPIEGNLASFLIKQALAHPHTIVKDGLFLNDLGKDSPYPNLPPIFFGSNSVTKFPSDCLQPKSFIDLLFRIRIQGPFHKSFKSKFLKTTYAHTKNKRYQTATTTPDCGQKLLPSELIIEILSRKFAKQNQKLSRLWSCSKNIIALQIPRQKKIGMQYMPWAPKTCIFKF